MQLFEIQNPNIRDRLRYNILPLEMEKPAILRSICIAQSRLADIKAQVDTQDRDSVVTLRRYISEYSSLLAPIRRLSVEILLLILLDPNIHGRERINSVMVAMHRIRAIGGVSYLWKEITRAIPQLWSSFKIDFRWQKWSEARLQRILRQTRIHLELSKDAPLSISFSSAYIFPRDESTAARLHTRAVSEITAEFLLHAERWAYLELPLEPNFFALLSSVQSRLLCLEGLGFGEAVGEHGLFDITTSKIFQDAPKLRAFSFSRPRSLEHIPPLPWRQFTQVSTPLESMHPVLELSPRLHDIIIYVASSDLARLRASHLGREMRKIVLVGTESPGGVGVVDALATIETPALKEIYLFQCWAWDPSTISALLQRSCCFLETLVLERSRVRPAALLALLRSMPALGTLALVDDAPNTLTNIVLDALTPCGQNVDILPSLHTLVLRGTTYLCTTDKLLAFLEGRMCFQHPLINIDIALGGRELRAPDLDRLAALPGRVVATYLPPVLSIHAGSPWQSACYSHPNHSPYRWHQ